MKHEILYLAQVIGSENISTCISHLKVMPSRRFIIKVMDPRFVSDRLCVYCLIPGWKSENVHLSKTMTDNRELKEANVKYDSRVFSFLFLEAFKR